MSDNVVTFPDKNGDGVESDQSMKRGAALPAGGENEGSKENGRRRKKVALLAGGPGERAAHLVTALHYLARETEDAGFVLAAHLIATAAKSVREEAGRAVLSASSTPLSDEPG